MDLVLFDEVLGPLVMEYMSFPDVQRLSITSRAYSTLKNVTARHSKYWKYLHNRQILNFMKEKSNENKKTRDKYARAINPECSGYTKSRVMIGINQQPTPINAGGYLANAWRTWLELKYTGEGEHGMQLSAMTYAVLSNFMGPRMILEKLEETGNKRKHGEINGKLLSPLGNFNCDAKYGCVNTRYSHIFFETSANTYLCSRCLDSPGMEVAKMEYLWEEMIDRDEWWFGETTYYTADDPILPPMRDNEMDWWGLQEDEKWLALFSMREVDGTDGMQHYPECRWIIEGQRCSDPLAMNFPETVAEGF